MEIEKLKRINKIQARKDFNNGKEIYLIACKLRLDNMWVKPYMITFHEEQNFDIHLSHFEYYNCNTVSGTYLHYYIEEKEIKK